MKRIDLNADLGEGGPDDAALMALVSSANIACGGHAGNADTMRTAIRLAMAAGVSIGAHPGYEDRKHFGRRPLDLPPEQRHKRTPPVNAVIVHAGCDKNSAIKRWPFWPELCRRIAESATSRPMWLKRRRFWPKPRA